MLERRYKNMKNYTHFILDLDGVIYRGEDVLPGARDFVEWADATGRGLVFLSNNSFATPEEVAAKLARLGIPDPERRTLTAGEAAVRVVAERFPGGSVYVLAVPSIVTLAERHGLRSIWQDAMTGSAPQALLVGLDKTLTYDRLTRGLRAILAGAAFVAVNRDPTLPVEDGLNPGTGSLVAALEYASGKRAEIVGKPEPGIVLEALRFLHASKDDTLLVGDSIVLDIAAGHAAGVDSALVLSGVATAQEAEAASDALKPNYVYANLAALLAAFQA
ncbi:MAG TPA: HAD-IIA family hydrolase [Ktedonobacterales bacterium]